MALVTNKTVLKYYKSILYKNLDKLSFQNNAKNNSQFNYF